MATRLTQAADIFLVRPLSDKLPAILGGPSLIAIFCLPFILAATLALGAEQTKPVQPDLTLMTPHKWADLSQSDQIIFALGALEYWGFALYSYDKPELSDFLACVRKEETKRFIGQVWLFGNVEESAVRDIIKATPTICSSYQGTGDGSREPLHILRKSAWKNYSLNQKTLYAMGFVEAAYIIDQTIDPKVPGQLSNCMRGVGVESLMSQVLEEEKTFNWNHPLPWLIAPSLGKACRNYH